MVRGRSGWRLVRASREAVPSSVRRFHQRIRRRRLRVAVPWAMAGTGLALAGLVAWLLLGTPLFAVRQIVVTGTSIATPDEVRAAAGVSLRTPLARVDLDAVRDRVAALKPVRAVRVDRDWPSVLVIGVTERTAVAAVPAAGGFALVDADGVAYHTVAARPRALPLVRLARPGPDDVTTRAALRVLAALTPTLRAQMTALVADAPARIRLELAGGRTVVWGDAEASDTKARVATGLLGRPGRVIDVSSAPDVVAVR